MSEPTAVAVVVVEHEGCVLIGRRPPGVSLAGYWEFPGGKVVAGESPEAAAVRECREETGLDVRIVRTSMVTDYTYRHGIIRLHFLEAELLLPCPRPAPARPFRWVRRRDLKKYRFPPANDAVVAKLLAR